MEKRRTRSIVAGVLLARVLLMVFALGFTGCDWIKDLLGLGEDDPKPVPGTPPEDPVYLRLYVDATPDSEATGGEEVDAPLGTEGNPFPTVAAALDAVAAAYTPTPDAVGSEESAEAPAEVKPWPGKNDGKPKPAEIVIAGKITVDGSSGPGISVDGIYPPLILSAQNPVLVDSEADSAGDITLSDGTGEYVSLLTVGDGVTLTLRNITLKGSKSLSSLVTVNKGGNLTLADNAVIYGHRNTQTSGGGVTVAKGGKFTMSGGVIRGNYAMTANGGGGVAVGAGGMFTMSGGVIWGNEAKVGGGVAVRGTTEYSGTFTMSGGVIRGNDATEKGGGVYVQNTGTFAKTGKSVIYGYDNAEDTADLNNTSNSNTNGNAVCVYAVLTPTGIVVKRDSTAGEDDDLSYNVVVDEDGKPITDGVWDSQP